MVFCHERLDLALLARLLEIYRQAVPPSIPDARPSEHREFQFCQQSLAGSPLRRAVRPSLLCMCPNLPLPSQSLSRLRQSKDCARQTSTRRDEFLPSAASRLAHRFHLLLEWRHSSSRWRWLPETPSEFWQTWSPLEFRRHLIFRPFTRLPSLPAAFGRGLGITKQQICRTALHPLLS